MVHLLTVLRRARKRAEGAERWFADSVDPDSKKRLKMKLDTEKKTVEKYQIWADELQKMIDGVNR